MLEMKVKAEPFWGRLVKRRSHSSPIRREITAKQGSRQTGGKWTRPDVIAVGYKTFPYLPGRYLEVVTFEIKPFQTTDVSAVYLLCIPESDYISGQTLMCSGGLTGI